MRNRNFKLFLSYRFLFTFAVMMMHTVVSWQVFALTKDPLSLGLIGLAEAIPYLCTSLVGGYTADIFERKRIALVASAVFGSCGLVLFLSTLQPDVFPSHNPWFYYALIFVTGIARGFLAPSVSALFAQVLPRELYSNGAAWNSNTWQAAAVAGPAAGGLVLGWFNYMTVYGSVVVLCFASLVMLLLMPRYKLPQVDKRENIFQSIRTGIRFVFANEAILGALTLDLVAVLFAGALAVLPAFVQDILKSGPETLGYLRAAPFLGSVIMGSVLAARRPMRNAGNNMLWCVAAYGVCIVLFALSRNFYLSFFLLALSGVFDSVSVVIRSTILQLLTPDHMRGRVSAVNNIFVGSSNELGAFESGVAARFLGLIPSVIIGGTVPIFATAATAWKAPRLRKLNLQELQHAS